jgi:hypothetical protein
MFDACSRFPAANPRDHGAPWGKSVFHGQGRLLDLDADGEALISLRR